MRSFAVLARQQKAAGRKGEVQGPLQLCMIQNFPPPPPWVEPEELVCEPLPLLLPELLLFFGRAVRDTVR